MKIRRWFGAAAAFLALAGSAGADDSTYRIQLLEKSWTPPAGVSAGARQAVAAQAATAVAAGEDKIHVLVQLYNLPNESEKNELWRQGLDLGTYATGRAWIAAVPANQVTALVGRKDVRAIEPWTAERKVHPRIKAGDFDSFAVNPQMPGWVMLFVQLHPDVELSRLETVAAAAGGQVGPLLEIPHGATVWVPRDRIAKLAQNEDVLWIEQGFPPLSPNNDGAIAQMNVTPLWAAPYGLDGTGVRLFVYDGGRVRPTHQTFYPGTGSRVTSLDATAIADHSTHVAGTAAGDGSGSAGGRGRGVADHASILSAGFQWNGVGTFFWDNAGDIQADYALARNTHNADLGTNSIGSNVAANNFNCAIEGDYGGVAGLIDGIVRGNNVNVTGAVLMTWANGNERQGGTPLGRCGGGYFTSGPPACAKNPIHIGAINSDGGSMTRFSSWGPCDDGRLKPVVSAPGCETGRVTGELGIYSSLATNDNAYGVMCGTSMATPAVAGLVSLYIQDWRALGHGGPNDRPLPALVKAMLIQSARDQGQDGPDYIHGYGSVDAKGLIDVLGADDGVLGNGGTPTDWGTDAVSQGNTDSFSFTVPAGTAELKASLAWDDYQAANFAANAWVNDLDLVLLDPSSNVVRPWILDPANPHLDATTGINTRDNQEQVRVLNPAAGVWTVQVTGTTVPQGPQSYGLVMAAKPVDIQTCANTAWDFESGNQGWNLSGAAVVAAPAAGHGTQSLQLGGAVNTIHEATIDVAVPNWVGKANWTFYWYMTTAVVQANGWGNDRFRAEVRDPVSGNVLSVVDTRYDGWKAGAWMHQAHIDLTPWMGQTVRLAFRAENSAAQITTFWVDDIGLDTCPLLETDAYTKDLTNDTGVEPDPLPGDMWNSPDIWVRNTNDQGTVHQNPEFGQTNYIYVNVRSRSAVEAINLPVNVYVANASMGLAWPIDWTFVGSVTIPSLLPFDQTTIEVPWNPSAVGHFCLLSRIVSGQDPMTFAETADVNLNTRNNNNIAWKNTNVVNLVLSLEEKVHVIYRNPYDKAIKMNFLVTDRSRDTVPFIRRGRITVALDDNLARIWADNGFVGKNIRKIDDHTFEVMGADGKAFIPLKARVEGVATVVFTNTPPTTSDTKTSFYVIDFIAEDTSNPLARDPVGGVTYEITALNQ